MVAVAQTSQNSLNTQRRESRVMISCSHGRGPNYGSTSALADRPLPPLSYERRFEGFVQQPPCNAATALLPPRPRLLILHVEADEPSRTDRRRGQCVGHVPARAAAFRSHSDPECGHRHRAAAHRPPLPAAALADSALAGAAAAAAGRAGALLRPAARLQPRR